MCVWHEPQNNIPKGVGLFVDKPDRVYGVGEVCDRSIEPSEDKSIAVAGDTRSVHNSLQREVANKLKAAVVPGSLK